MQLLWRGIAAYIFQNNIELMFGCASLPGTDPDALALELSYLYHHHLAPEGSVRGPCRTATSKCAGWTVTRSMPAPRSTSCRR